VTKASDNSVRVSLFVQSAPFLYLVGGEFTSPPSFVKIPLHSEKACWGLNMAALFSLDVLFPP